MCGLSGYINLSKNSIDEKVLHKMQAVQEHRGPDDFGIWKSDVLGIGLSHRRLSIIDTSSAGKQPMQDIEGTVIVSFNGEIYNHLLIRKRLEALGYKYFSNTDTETIIYAYKEWGINFVYELEGMFAISLVDVSANEVYLIRDRIGVKPLYFSVNSNVIGFASEIKALWELPISKEINELAMYHYLTYLVTPAPMTLYKNVYKLPAGFYAKISRERDITFKEWYSPLNVSKIDDSLINDEQYCVEQIRLLLRDSIKKRMMSDVPFGVFLSGGVDSSLNVALMSEFTTKVKTFNVVFADGLEFDERKWARKVSDKFGTDHQEIVISEKEAFEFYEKMIFHQDEPLADWVCIPLYFVSKLAKDSGVTVVQCGEGADELFCGYDAYAHYIDIYNKYWKVSSKLPSVVRRGVYNLFKKVSDQNNWYLDHVKNWANDRNLFWSGAVAFKENFKTQIMHSQFSLHNDPIVSKIYAGLKQQYDSYSIVDYHLGVFKKLSPDGDFLRSMVYLELKQRLPELLLMRLDKMSMAASIEGRVPFLDHKLVEFALQIPMNLKYRNGITKYILKKAAEGILSNDIIYRKKVGFAAPVKKWFQSGNYFKKYYIDSVNSSRYLKQSTMNKLLQRHENTDVSPQLWCIQNLISFLK